MKKYRQPWEPMVICIPTPILKLPISWPGCFSIRLPPRALQTIPATSTPQLTTRKWNKKCNRNAIKREKKPQSLDFTGSAAHLRLFELFPKFLSATLKCWYFLHFGYIYFAKYYSFRIVFTIFSSKLVAVSAPIIFHRLDIIYFLLFTTNKSMWLSGYLLYLLPLSKRKEHRYEQQT